MGVKLLPSHGFSRASRIDDAMNLRAKRNARTAERSPVAVSSDDRRTGTPAEPRREVSEKETDPRSRSWKPLCEVDSRTSIFGPTLSSKRLHPRSEAWLVFLNDFRESSHEISVEHFLWKLKESSEPFSEIFPDDN
ncbi:unnamed protein product [Darwinula stevensoni]|uniref:Uncharacterized protein n=1 Tax=Darwinula stevensoni TaxID=69355 RepID=A0A7R8XA75_9CRUS|nr:unnamed protein product [Darwinula stevensoni]CAG0885156.1 unnamed protein product [Darwinula stevensoni]